MAESKLDELVTQILTVALASLDRGESPTAEKAFERALAGVDPGDRLIVEHALTRALLATWKPNTREALEEAVRRRSTL